MTQPRKQKVDISRTCYYHCFSRCVRQSYLCGVDPLTQKDYSYRKGWIVDRIKQAADAFAIGVCAYAVMSNHYHLVLEVKPDTSAAWDDDTVLFQWGKIYATDAKATAALKAAGVTGLYEQRIQKIREHLTDISWFMKSINEWVARQSNRDDEKKGRFWDGRFGSQALLDDTAVLSAMAYVDLNPIRAGICKTPETSDYTSIQARIQAYAEKKPQPSEIVSLQPRLKNAIQFSVEDYLTLVDITGRHMRANKGYIPETLAPLLQRLRVEESGWFTLMHTLETSFSYAVGHHEALSNFSLTKRNLKGSRFSKSVYQDRLAA